MLEHSWRAFPDWIPVFISVPVLQMGRAGRAVLVMGLNGTESPTEGDPPLPHIQTSSQRSPWTGSGLRKLSSDSCCEARCSHQCGSLLALSSAWAQRSFLHHGLCPFAAGRTLLQPQFPVILKMDFGLSLTSLI